MGTAYHQGFPRRKKISLHHAGPPVINLHTEIFDPGLSYYPWGVSGNRHGPRVELAIPALIAYEYRCYIIMTWARPESNGYTSAGIVCKRDQFGSKIKIQRFEGVLFGIKERAEQHAVELGKVWIDNLTPKWLR